MQNRLALRVRRAGRTVVELGLEPGVFTIGRSAASSVAIDDPLLSRCHAVLTVERDGECHLQDVGSRNGTFIDGDRVGRIRLALGTEFFVGSHRCVVVQAEGDRPAARVDSPTEDATRDDAHPAGETSGRAFLGSSEPTRALLKLVQRVAATTTNVLVTGPSGSGKGLVGQLLHRHGARADGPFVPVNCAAIPRELVESELFGHRRGAFTGAVADQLGKFREADGGTLFLDEIGDMAPPAQAKILRALEDGEVEPVGGGKTVSVDVRVIAASHRDLERAIADGAFRADLYYRLATVRIDVPPLADRAEDVPLLANHFLAELMTQIPAAAGSYFTSGAIEALSDHSWPGNVRELRNVVAQALVRKDGLAIEPRHLEISGAAADGPVSEAASPLERGEARAIRRALAEHDGNLTRTAAALGITRKTLRRRMERHGIERGSGG